MRAEGALSALACGVVVRRERATGLFAGRSTVGAEVVAPDWNERAVRQRSNGWLYGAGDIGSANIVDDGAAGGRGRFIESRCSVAYRGAANLRAAPNPVRIRRTDARTSAAPAAYMLGGTEPACEIMRSDRWPCCPLAPDERSRRAGTAVGAPRHGDGGRQRHGDGGRQRHGDAGDRRGTATAGDSGTTVIEWHGDGGDPARRRTGNRVVGEDGIEAGMLSTATMHGIGDFAMASLAQEAGMGYDGDGGHDARRRPTAARPGNRARDGGATEGLVCGRR